MSRKNKRKVRVRLPPGVTRRDAEEAAVHAIERVRKRNEGAADAARLTAREEESPLGAMPTILMV